ncbi:Isoprenylcysteine carboxyl methyltransferase family-domain-containing protein [Leucosporidium creatinivorum]|uniref:Protein-S-isoprenylcysteine O-methyltransferase n=1 Tax=Leucosporidium creatinivorum TaxID=106004 RepID=A0A1Y2FMV0_9BASI|nr:Isoprenylcysteine carboxyl methyltransferase family-domain-containing protein [Leucosporidium creatinivorum]
MGIDIFSRPEPASPFEPRPAPTVSDAASPAASSSSTDKAADGDKTSTPTVSQPTSSRPYISYPLGSFESTPHNVACISFLLGALWFLGLSLFFNLVFRSEKWLLWSPNATGEELGAQGLREALKSPVLGVYLASWAMFHLLEFVVTSMWNPGKLSVSSFLLDNGNAYHVAHLVGILEHVLEDAYLPAHWRKYKHMGGLIMLGWGLLIGGQILRSFAMITASSNFSHIVAFSKLPSHQLVKTGIYAWSRHPSYAGFVWWALGTQIMLVNPIGTIAFSAVLYYFFSNRIRVEEKLLVKFFGDDYIEYRKKVPTRIFSFTATDSDSAALSWASLTPPFARSVQAVLREEEAPKCGIDDRIITEYGETNLRLSKRHEGSRYRLGKVLDKARRGEKIRVAVLGGSVSTGHGHANGKNYQYGAVPNPWWTFVRTYFNETFGGVENVEFVDGARPAVDSNYFYWCYTAHIGTDIDLVFLESAVNDVYSQQSLSDAEDLLRSILQLPTEPAVIYVDAFALRTQSGRDGMLNGGDGHAPLAAFYDVPQLSLRGPLIPSLLRNKSLAEPYFQGDVRHIAAPLHRYLGDMVVAFLQETACSVPSIVETTSAVAAIDSAVSNSTSSNSTSSSSSTSVWVERTEDWVGKVPRLKITDSWDSPLSYPSSPPICHLAGRDLQPSTPSRGWKLWDWKDEKFYWQVKTPSSEATFDIEVRKGGEGIIAISYLRSKAYELGRVVCSVGDQRTSVDGHWERSVSVAQTAIIATGLPPGTHQLLCTTPNRPPKGRNVFRLIGVLSR